MYHSIFLILCFFQQSPAKDTCISSEFSLNGDYILGGLFPVHNITNKGTSGFPVAMECDRLELSAAGYQKLQVMRFAVEEINNSTSILPDVSLGYEIFDHCSDLLNFPSVFEFLSHNSSVNFEEYKEKIVSVIGPYGSSETLTIAPFFMMDLVPMVNYGSSSSRLSDKNSFPSFLRTLPSNKGQVQLIIRILQRYKWNWIAFIGSENDYSQDALQLFIDGIRDTSICLAYQEHLNRDSKLRIILQKINGLHINVIIVYVPHSYATALMESAIQNNIRDKVWIASGAWSMNKALSARKGLDTIGTIIGITERVVSLPGFQGFVNRSQGGSKFIECKNRKLKQKMENQDFRTSCNQACNQCPYLDPITIINEDPSFNLAIYSAVYVVAKALHTLLHCDATGCNKTKRVCKYELLRLLKQSNYTLLNQQIKFDENGDSPVRHDIVFWNLDTTPPFQFVGSYDTEPAESFSINETLIHWYTNGSIPVSRCSKECQKGSFRIQSGSLKCCFECELCPKGTYVNHSADPSSCIPCMKNQWADPGSTSCTERVVEYIRITEPLSVLLLLSVSFMLCLAAAIAILFARNYDTPVVRSAGGKMCFLMLGCLSCSGFSVFFYFGIPNQIKCVFRNASFPLFYTVCLSCLTVRSFQIVYIFKMAAKLPRAYDWWVKYNGQWLFIVVASTVQLILCAISVPRPVNDTVTFKDRILLNCEIISLIPSSTVLFAGFLSIFCFTFSYMGSDLPKSYNEAKSITFSVLLFYISWISYMTIYLDHASPRLPVIKAFSELASSYGILLSYFVPKSYIIIFKPEKNTQAHFQSRIQDYTQNISRK